MCYELLAKRVRTPDWAFMNYGYAPTPGDADAPPAESIDDPDRLCIQLYLRAIEGAELTGRDVLEVGSGRGGGAAYLSSHFRPRSMTGLDFSQEAVELCNRHRRVPGLTFVRGDALSMPFADGSFDVVVNIESSHCYEDMNRFLSEVKRVLRPGGWFHFADLRSAHGADVLRGQLASCGLTVVDVADISLNVLAALRLDNARKLRLIEAWIPHIFRRSMRVLAGVEGTMNYRRLASGKWRYLTSHLMKPYPLGHGLSQASSPLP